MTKIMILGTGFGQLPLINACQALGLTTVGVDRDSNSIGANLVDIFHCVDIKNTPELVKLAEAEVISGVVTMQSDVSVPSIGKINDVMGLTGVTEASALICSNKNLTRDMLTASGVIQPKYELVRTLSCAKDAVDKMGFPCVIKSPDSSGSRGVTKLTSADQLERGFCEAELYSQSGIIIVEEFISGIEIGAQTFSENGECIYCLLHNDTLSDNGFMVPVGHSYPFREPGVNSDKIKKEITKALKAVGLGNGPANIDLILSSDGNPYIIEIGARCGATCLPELTSIYSGQDWAKRIVINCIGKKMPTDEFLGQPCAALILQSPSDGIFDSVVFNFSEEEYQDFLVEIEVTVNLGDSVSMLRKGTDRIGKVVVVGQTAAQAEKIAKEIVSKIEIVVKSSE